MKHFKNTIKDLSWKLFDSGKSPEEVLEILSEKDIKTNIRVIKVYYRLWKSRDYKEEPTIKDRAYELFDSGKSAREVFEILSEQGVKTKIRVIREYHRMWRKDRGYKKEPTIKERAYKLFDSGKSPEEVLKTLSEQGVKSSLRTISGYYSMWKYGCNTYSEYREYRKRLKRPKENEKNVFKTPYERRIYLTDPYFGEIYSGDIPSEWNPYLLMWKWLKNKDVEARDLLIENYLKEMDALERIMYIGKLRRGLEILKELGKEKSLF